MYLLLPLTNRAVVTRLLMTDSLCGVERVLGGQGLKLGSVVVRLSAASRGFALRWTVRTGPTAEK
jgi:hypothetical protein